jgi:hypothetical protein
MGLAWKDDAKAVNEVERDYCFSLATATQAQRRN